MLTPIPPLALTEPYYDNGGRIYVRCTNDQALPLFAQDAMIKNSGYVWNVKDLEGSGHSPFLSRPEELAKILMEVFGGLRF